MSGHCQKVLCCWL